MAPVPTSWLARFGVRFPGLSVSVGGLVALVLVARVPCGLFMVFCLVECSLSACFCLALQVPVHLFILLGPDLSLSLSLSRFFLLQPSRPRGCSLLAPVSVFAAIVARVVPRHLSCGIPVGIPQFLCGYLPVRYFPSSWWGPALLLFPWCPSSPFFWFVRGVRWSSWLSPLPAALLWIVVFSVPCGLVGASATFSAALHPASPGPLGCSTISSLGVSSMCAFLDSRLLCSLAG